MGLYFTCLAASLYVLSMFPDGLASMLKAPAGCSREFTNKLFSHSPGLLNALLTKANSSQHDFDDVRRTF
jgi:hypothetical protein